MRLPRVFTHRQREQVLTLRMPTVPASSLSEAQLAQIKTALVRQAGRPYGELEKERHRGNVLPSSAATPQAEGAFWYTDREAART